LNEATRLIAETLTSVEARQEEIKKEMETTRKRFGEISGQLDELAGVIPLVAVETEDAVRFYPVVLACLGTYLGVAYLLLHVRKEALYHACQENKLPPEATHFFLGSLPEARVNARDREGWMTRVSSNGAHALAGLVFLGLFGDGLRRLIESESFVTILPRGWYWAGAGCVVVSGLALFFTVLWPGGTRQMAGGRDWLQF
jgi:hypothetical protein